MQQLSLFSSSSAAPPRSTPWSPSLHPGYGRLRGRQVVLEGFTKGRTCSTTCSDVAVITPGKGPHIGQLRCADCGGPRGWLNKTQADFFLEFVRRFGGFPEALPIIRCTKRGAR